MTDQEAIQGVWKLVKITCEGGPVHTSTTHRVFDGQVSWEVVKDFELYEDDGRLVTEFELRPGASPRLILMRMTWFDAGGKIKSKLHLQSAYELGRDELRIASSDEVVSDEEGSLEVYVREIDPSLVALHSRPVPRKARRTFEDERLGRLGWDANLGWWVTEYEFEVDRPVELFVSVPVDADASMFRRAGEIARGVQRVLREVKQFAADELVELKNRAWLREGEAQVGVEAFVSLMRVESVHVRQDGDVEVCFKDGGLFWGHSIEVTLDADLKPIEAGI